MLPGAIALKLKIGSTMNLWAFDVQLERLLTFSAWSFGATIALFVVKFISWQKQETREHHGLHHAELR